MAINLRATATARASRRARLLAQIDADLREVDALREKIKLHDVRIQVATALSREKFARLDAALADLARTR